MKTRVIATVFLLCLVAPIAGADGPPASAPDADCTTYDLPAGGFIMECEGEYLIGLPHGGA